MTNEIIGPHPFGSQITTQQLFKQFSEKMLWEERYRQLILLSRQFPLLDDQFKQQPIELKGCENRVWLGYQKLADGTLHFYGDSEGRIVKGLLAILFTLIEKQTPQQLLVLNPLDFYLQLGIYQELSTSRESGIRALIDRVREIAQAEA